MAQHKSKTAMLKAAFLAAYAETGNISQAAEAAQVGRRSHYRWLARDKRYAEAFAEATEQAGDALEQEARRRAVDGVDEPVFYQGAQCGLVRKYSDTLLIFLLKGVRPEKFKDRHEHTGKDGGAIEIREVVVELPGEPGIE